MTSPSFSAEATSSIPIITSKAIHQFFGFGLVFRGWIYATATITLTPKHLPLNSNSKSIACVDTGCGVILVDKGWLLKYLLTQKINIMSTLLKVRRIEASKYKSRKFTALSLYFSGKNNVGQLVYTSLTYKIHLVKDLRANLLISNDIISSKIFVIDVKGRSAFIGSCGVTVAIDAKQRGQFLTRKLLVSQETVVSPHSEAMILLVSLLLFDNCDFLFYLTT